MSEVIRFSLPVERRKTGSRYYRVLIFPDKEAMWAYDNRPEVVRMHNFKGPFDHAAITHRFDTLSLLSKAPKRWRKSLRIGAVLFHQKHLGSGIVSHEMTHAALYSFPNWRKRDIDRLDEKLAGRVGLLTNRFWTAYYKRVPHEEPKPKK